MIINALIDNKILLFNNNNIMFANEIKSGLLIPVEDYSLIIEIINKIKSEKQNLINLGFIDNKKVIMDTFSENKYYYEYTNKYNEVKEEVPEYVTKIIMSHKVILFNELPNNLSKEFIEYNGEIPIIKGFPSLNKLYLTIDNLVKEEKEIKLNEDYKDNTLKYEKTYLKLLMEIIKPNIILDSYYKNNDKLIINVINKHLNIEETYQILNLTNIELLKKLFYKVNNFEIKKDLICMALINSLHNKIEVEKFYFEEDLVSEYAYLKKNGQLIILHDQNRFI